MNLPFTQEQFFAVFSNYNTSVFPFQIVLYIMALAISYFLFKPTKYSNKLITLILAFYWLWMGVVYHLMFFTPINPAAKIFGVLFILQGILFAYTAIKNKFEFLLENNIPSYIGVFFIVFGTILYPLVGLMIGHVFPNSSTFGLPCPTTIFTFGVLILAPRIQRYIIIIPLLWSLLGFSAAFSLGVKEDFSLLIAGIVGSTLILLKNSAVKIKGSTLLKGVE